MTIKKIKRNVRNEDVVKFLELVFNCEVESFTLFTNEEFNYGFDLIKNNKLVTIKYSNENIYFLTPEKLEVQSDLSFINLISLKKVIEQYYET